MSLQKKVSCLRLRPWANRKALLLVAFMLVANTAFAQSDPWSLMAQKLIPIFTGPVAKAFVIVGCVVGGLSMVFSEGGSKRTIGNLIFGGALALGAVQMVAYLFS